MSPERTKCLYKGTSELITGTLKMYCDYANSRDQH